MRSVLSRALARPNAWSVYLLLAAVPMVLAPLALTSEWGQSAVTAGVGWASALACAWRWRTGRGVPTAWVWIGAGLALNASGSLVEAFETDVLGIASPSPGLPDVLYLSLYPCVTVGLLIIVRSRCAGLGPAKLIDAGVMTVGLGLLCWVFLIHPTFVGASGSLVARAVVIAYPVGDLMLLAILARVIAAEGWRTPTVLMLCVGLVCFLFGDTAWALVNNNGWGTTQFEETLLSEPFLIAFAVVAAAALHWSAVELDATVASDEERISRALLASLTVASLTAPAILAGEAIDGQVKNGLAIAICSAQLTLLVVARVSYLLHRVQQQASRLRELALEDALTGLPNRRALQGYLTESLARARRGGRPLSLAVLDLDRFKQFNDQLGHAAGDQLLKSAASAWSSEIRASDMLARIGGEEFVLVLPDAGASEATDVVTKLKTATPLGQTLSAGVAEWDTHALADELLKQADDAMYAAKRAGRNRIELSTGGAGPRDGELVEDLRRTT